MDSCLSKVDGWKSKWLTSMGRILMLKSVISAIPIFSMMYLRILSQVIKVIEQKMRNFFWNGNHDQDEIHFLAWDSICKPKHERGAGLTCWHIMVNLSYCCTH